jgi:hypothetical protein
VFVLGQRATICEHIRVAGEVKSLSTPTPDEEAD